MNLTGSKQGSFDGTCPMNEMVWKQEYHVEKITFAMIALILNILSFPVTILMNVLVIMAVKTRPRLQSNYNILLACLEFISGVAAVMVLFLNISLIIVCHLSVYFVTRRHEKQIKCEQVSPQAAADFAKEKKALKTTG